MLPPLLDGYRGVLIVLLMRNAVRCRGWWSLPDRSRVQSLRNPVGGDSLQGVNV